jgi:hypothetical protein
MTKKSWVKVKDIVEGEIKAVWTTEPEDVKTETSNYTERSWYGWASFYSYSMGCSRNTLFGLHDPLQSCENGRV